jgi:hypothetical protein
MLPFVVAAAAFLVAESGDGLAQLNTTEQILADKIKCGEWKKNQDGSWISKPNTKIGSYSQPLPPALGRWMEQTLAPF